MADFAQWGAAASSSFGSSPEEFLRIYTEKWKGTRRLVLDTDVLARPIKDIVQQGKWEGTASELLEGSINFRSTRAAVLLALPCSP